VKLVGRIMLVGVLGIIAMILTVIGLGYINSVALPNLLCEVGLLSPHQAGGLPVPLTTVSVRAINVVEWFAVIGVVGSFAYISVLNFERFSSGEETPAPRKPSPGGVPRARPAPSAQPDPSSSRPSPPPSAPGGESGPPRPSPGPTV
jgi:hypothetical protein